MSTTSTNESVPNGSISKDATAIYNNVQSHYSTSSKTHNATYSNTVASAFGYSPEELTNAPSESNLGLSCGNPFVIANLRDGETVVDLGSGAGFDVFQAAKKVGRDGRVVGVDMNDDMLHKANHIKAKVSTENVDFVKSRITAIELGDASADCIISNCVINLVPEHEKRLVFNEMYRILKPGGRVAVSDVLLKRVLPEKLKGSVELYVGCVAGASMVGKYETYFKEAGFQDVMIVGDQSDLNVYKTAGEDGGEVGCCGPAKKKEEALGCGGGGAETNETNGKLEDVNLNEWAGSYKIYAVKPKT